ncbi:DUF3783 domain-containing protein [Anaerocolumna xylanovorans]|uniref:DUF3783 domain-containing protein n=1 Tax=Anaerocolumna xylanovorans DSM 12503 TaxID=1121345 RepID=A0A1M7YFE1_9FIRM|nr:DUF3783 domain-containing protein [Anaerocolumna xylanovorans]SHO51367.1 protein of unknown function [Anaerocolumna xylanovorans DSM 12503]
MKEKVLLFNIPLREKRLKIGRALLPLNIAVKAIERKEYGQSIGYLAGYKDMPETREIYDGEELEGEMVIMAGLSGGRTEMVLAALRKAGVQKTCLKAVLTDTNRFWNAKALYEELGKEYNRMNGQS